SSTFTSPPGALEVSAFQSAVERVKRLGGSAVRYTVRSKAVVVRWSEYSSLFAPPFHICSGGRSPRGKTVASYGYANVVTAGSAITAPFSVCWSPGERPAGFSAAFSATVTFAVAVSPKALAVTVTTPNVVPVGVTTPLPGLTEAMSSRSRVQLALTSAVVLSANVATAVSAWVGGFDGSVTVIVAVAGLMARPVTLPWSASKSRTGPSSIPASWPPLAVPLDAEPP